MSDNIALSMERYTLGLKILAQPEFVKLQEMFYDGYHRKGQ